MKKKESAWVVPKGLFPMQTFSPNIIQFLRTFYHDMGFFYRGKHRTMTEWMSEWSRRLNIMDVQTLLAHDCYVRGVSIRKSTIKSEIAGKGLFAEKNFVKGDVLSYYYGCLLYTSPSPRDA